MTEKTSNMENFAIEDFYRRAAKAIARDEFSVDDDAEVLLTSVGGNVQVKRGNRYWWVYVLEATAHRALLGTLGYEDTERVLNTWRR